MSAEREALRRMVDAASPLFESTRVIDVTARTHVDLARALAHAHAVLEDGE